MTAHAIRLTFADEATAVQRWEPIGDRLSDRVKGFARKREGSCHVVLLREISSAEARAVAAWCARQWDVVTVSAINEAEFWAARSNPI